MKKEEPRKPAFPCVPRRLTRLKKYALLIILSTVLSSVSPGLSHGEAPKPADILAGERSSFRPLFRFQPEFSLFEFSFTSRGHAGSVEAFPIDTGARAYAPSLFIRGFARGRIYVDSKVRYSNFRFMTDLEFDFTDPGTTQDSLPEGSSLPYSGQGEQEIRKALATVALARTLFLAGGITQSHWGLGLMANHGDRRWAPGSARFGDPIGGDKVLRAMIATRKYSAHKLQFYLAYDKVLRDEELHEQDNARILSSAIRFRTQSTLSGGILWRMRDQDSYGEGSLERQELNLHLSHTQPLTSGTTLKSALEAFTRWGDLRPGTNQGTQQSKIRAHALALESLLDLGGYGLNFDALYSSGDQDPLDEQETQATIDPNYEVGLILFPLIRSAQSKYRDSRALLANAGLSANSGNDALESRAGLESAFVVFPKIWWRISDGLEAYSGVLLAWETGQAPKSISSTNHQDQDEEAADQSDSKFLGAEYDLGIRYTVLMKGSELSIGVEAGLFQHGPAMGSASEDSGENTGLIRTLWSLRI